MSVVYSYPICQHILEVADAYYRYRLYIEIWEVVWHPLRSRCSYCTRKCTSGCATTTVPTSLFIHTMKKIQNILYIFNKGINNRLPAIVFLLSKYPFVTRCRCASQWEKDDGHNLLLRASISHYFPDKRMARSWSLANSGCDLFSWNGSVKCGFLLRENDRVVHKRLCHYQEPVLGWPPWNHHDTWRFLLNDFRNQFSN